MVKLPQYQVGRLVLAGAQAVKHVAGNLRPRVRLADFIRANTEQIVSEWEQFAQTLTPAADSMTPLALRDHIHQILEFIVNDMKSPQSRMEQVRKSQGQQGKNSDVPSASEIHTALRMAGGFNIDQMVSEYRALRASVMKLWSTVNAEMDNKDVRDVTRFNESIDQALAELVSQYTQAVGYSKDLFTGILSHELRTPLNVISMSAQLLLRGEGVNERHTMLALQIYESTCRITQLVTTLVDATRARVGLGLPIIRAPMDMGAVSRKIVDEMRIAHPTCMIALDVLGDVKGEWDKARIGQVLANLIGNAIQYSDRNSPIGVIVKGAVGETVLAVHNEGMPIPPDKIKTIFDPLDRAITPDGDQPGAINLGFELYITKEIVVSHGGTIDVTSSEEKGTTFTARFPRSENVA